MYGFGRMTPPDGRRIPAFDKPARAPKKNSFGLGWSSLANDNIQKFFFEKHNLKRTI